jgi:lipopolysaccharide heptosyltransferase III
VSRPDKQIRKPLRYRVDGWIRDAVMRAISGLAPRSKSASLDPRSAAVTKILLVRANFRMGNAILALPAIAAFRKNFPNARIDFVGSPISHLLFQGQPLNDHFVAPRRFPGVLWGYPQMMRRLRATRYDLAVEVSCSQSGIGSFIVGLSGARIRAGVAGKWDRLFNLRVGKLTSPNKYRKLGEFLGALGLQQIDSLGSLAFSAAETTAGLEKLQSLTYKRPGNTVGVFVGGRKLRGKRWPLENFIEVVEGLQRDGATVIVFLGPEEKDIADALRASLDASVPLVFEPSARKFAAIVAHLDLLICCDSGPMHLACATGVRVVAIFQARDVARWSPPASAARIVAGAHGASPAMVLEAARDELSLDKANVASTSPPPARLAGK